MISGAASARGIGRATANLFAEHGARVAILDLDEAGAQRAAKELGEGHVGIGCDVTDPESCRRAARQAIDAFGQIDILINNAGISQPVKTMEITPQDWQRIVDVNMTGVLYLSQAVIPHMRERKQGRSEEHTSELQSRQYLVCRLLLEKKNTVGATVT